MKHMLDDIFEELAPNEFDKIMPDNLDVKLPKTVLKRIEKKTLQKSGIKNNRQHFNFKILAPIAACLVFVAGIGGFAMVAEAKEYNAAVDFFAQNGLSSEGLSRGDLKAVYHDISANHFTNNKTAEVIRRSVPGMEIFQQEPTPEELSALWNHNMQNSAGARKGIEYYTKYKFDETLGFDVFDKSVVECYNDNETIWATEITSFKVLDCALTSNGTAAWGNTWRTWSNGKPCPTWLAMLDNSGNKLWERQLDHDFESETIAAVLDNDDGTWAVISCGDREYLCLAQYDMNGNELNFTKTNVGNTEIFNAARLGDDYLVHLYNYHTSGDTAHLVKLNRDGSITDTFVYKSEDCNYCITDMTEFGGQMYLSAYTIPKQIDEGFRHDIENVLDSIVTKGNWETFSEELTSIVRENYTAVLLLCNPSGGEPTNFYSVKGSLGGTLAIEGDQLKWNVESVVSTYYSPLTNSYTVGVDCRVYRYSFDQSGSLAECEDTGETTDFGVLHCGASPFVRGPRK